MTCKKCGQPLENGTNYCPNCGIQVGKAKIKYFWFAGRSNNKAAQFLKVAAVIFMALGLLFSLFRAFDFGYLGVEAVRLYASEFHFLTLCSGVAACLFKGAVLFGIGELIDVIDVKFCDGEKF